MQCKTLGYQLLHNSFIVAVTQSYDFEGRGGNTSGVTTRPGWALA